MWIYIEGKSKHENKVEGYNSEWYEVNGWILSLLAMQDYGNDPN